MSETTYPVVWDLDSLYPNPTSNDFVDIFQEAKTSLEGLAERAGNLPEISTEMHDVSPWVGFLKDYEAVGARLSDLRSFVGCHAAADAGNKTYRTYEAKLAAIDPLRESIETNIELAVKAVDEATLREFIVADPYLSQVGFLLTNARDLSSLRFDKDEELLASELAVDGLHAWGRLYDRVSGDLRIDVMERGEIVSKSPGQVTFDSSERSLRQNNFYAADKAWASVAETCAYALNHIAGTRLTRYKRLGLHDHLEAPLLYNRMKRETLETMWSVISKRKAKLVEYLNKKAELLGLSKLAWYDQSAPIPTANSTDRSITYDMACETIFRTFEGFSPDFGQFARDAIGKGWIEAENRGGKRQGGFCTDIPGKKETRIFMTFTDSADSMSTLAHELGHAYHTWVLRDQPFYLQDYPMNLAETASTFAEQILGQERLDVSFDRDEQLTILDGMLGDAVAFLMNIHSRFLFENSFHQERPEGEVSPERLCELMLAAQKEAYCDALADDGWNGHFWASKLHFYISQLPFYNFPYTFGYLLSLGLYANADETEDFPAQYREFLIATGCMSAEEAVQSTLGFDLTEPEFWEQSINVIDERVNRFVQLAEG
ncbi:M3 family oligoendopeptidase [Calycomorphotria hydatis]|uniref:Oligoendopeptidase F, plasmid n=1 Tax=Calycomorphotria hydatis TaxID=2528027 RepID=A0A517TF05_9PLAN|nr:M3 family oligoendopeptidase [Calycomorphotria hydatis]QDT66948.1 Oligoendopeptidase F, plasmid [Calycomorphotria hydatis]